MNNDTWIEHLSHWKEFLEKRLESVQDEGEREKISRQLIAIERVRYSAVLNPELLIEFIEPFTKVQSIEQNPINYYLDLNESQKQAVKSVLEGSNFLTLIQGPPGTGKTQVIAEICMQLLDRDENTRILVCSETHVAVNNILSRISTFDKDIRIVRLRDKDQGELTEQFSPKRISDSFSLWLEENIDDADIVNVIKDEILEPESKSFEKALALSANIIGVTCNRIGAYKFLDTTEMFDFAIIDEVCKATLPEILMPMAVSRKAVLVGDPKQLPPVFCSEEVDVIRSLENCNLQQYMYIDTLFYTLEDVIALDTQYRMEKSIGKMISDLFYGGLLKNGRVDSVKESLLWIDYRPSKHWPEMENTLSNDKPNLINLDECRIIFESLNILERLSKINRTVAVIVPYRDQVSQIKGKIPVYDKLRVIVDTVDGFQGKECDIVIFGLTRTTGSFRFLADERRLNVALSRAKDQIIIVGSKEYADRHPILKKVGEYCHIIPIRI